MSRGNNAERKKEIDPQFSKTLFESCETVNLWLCEQNKNGRTFDLIKIWRPGSCEASELINASNVANLSATCALCSAY